jgi:hypothetical protein
MCKLIIPVRSSDFDMGQEFATVPESIAYMHRLNIVVRAARGAVERPSRLPM